MTKLMIEKYECFKCEVLATATGANLHKLNGKIGAVCMTIDLYEKTHNSKYQEILKRALLEISILSHICYTIDDFIQD